MLTGRHVEKITELTKNILKNQHTQHQRFMLKSMHHLLQFEECTGIVESRLFIICSICFPQNFILENKLRNNLKLQLMVK